jgi:hypothetical protein
LKGFLKTGVLVPYGLSVSPFILGSVRYKKSANLRAQELKPSDESPVVVIVPTGFHQYEVDRPSVLNAGAPSLTSAGGFQDRVAEATQDQGLRHQSGWIMFDKKNGLDGDSVFTKK